MTAKPERVRMSRFQRDKFHSNGEVKRLNPYWVQEQTKSLGKNHLKLLEKVVRKDSDSNIGTR